jgi:hypothetical protein
MVSRSILESLDRSMERAYSLSDSLDSLEGGASGGYQSAMLGLVDAAHAAWSPGTYVAKVIGDSVGRGIERAIAAHLASALQPLLLLAAVVVVWRLCRGRMAAPRPRRPASAQLESADEGRLHALDALHELHARATSLEEENRELRLAAVCRKAYLAHLQTQPQHPSLPPLELEYLAAVEEGCDAGQPDARQPDAGELSQLASLARARRGGLVRKTAVLAFLTARGLPHALYERVRVDAALRALEQEVGAPG